MLAAIHRDPHIATFDGLDYDFQTAGEFVLTRQTSSGNFQVQARLSAPVGTSSYSVITELGMQVGTDVVTIDSTRAATVWVNGTPATFTAGIVALADGQITQTATGYVITLNTGEAVTAMIDSVGVQYGPATTSAGIDVVVTLNPFVELPGTVEGLLGNANGNPSQDLTLADGTVLPTNMQPSELYRVYADAWRVTQATSLLDYGQGQTTATFTDENYPGTPITLASFPQAAVQAAEALAAKVGITDRGLQQDAAYDYLVTGDPNSFAVEERVQQQGVATTVHAQITTPAGTVPDVGIYALRDSVSEAATGSTIVDFQLYRSGDTSEAVTLSYSVVAPNDTYVDASAFGSALPSGTVTLGAGQTSADLPITLTQGIGAAASRTLAVQVTAPSPADVIGSTAGVLVANSAPTASIPPAFAVELLNDATVTPTVSDNAWTFDLGPLSYTTFGNTGTIELAVVNTAALGSDNLGGTIAASSDDGLATTAVSSFASLAASEILDVADFSLGPSTTASGTETLTFTLSDTNSTGYSATLPAQTVTIGYTAPASTMPCFAVGTRIATETGERTVQSLRVGDRVRTISGALRPITWIGSRTVDCARHANPAAVRPVRVRAGAFGPGLPRRDLFLSPDHAVFVSGVLVPIKYLLDGVAIVQTRRKRVTYFHIELATHDVLLAEGLPAESYLDTGDRNCFADNGIVRLHPDFGARRADLMWEAAGYAPLVITGPKVGQIKDLIARERRRFQQPNRAAM